MQPNATPLENPTKCTRFSIVLNARRIHEPARRNSRYQAFTLIENFRLAVYLSFAIQAVALVVKVAPHFGQRTSVELMRSTSAGVILCRHCGQGVASDARTFSRSIFRRVGTRGFYSQASQRSCSLRAALAPAIPCGSIVRSSRLRPLRSEPHNEC